MRILLFMLALSAGCATSQPDAPTSAVPAVEWGSSFGMCAGFCASSLVVTPDGTATLTETATRSPDVAPRVRARMLTADEQARLAAANEASTVVTDTLGCPDCADGGAEYVERDGARVTFDYGGDAGAAAPLAEALRSIRESFPRL